MSNVVGSRDFDIFRSAGLKCASVKKWSRGWLRARKAPRGFRCRNLDDASVDVVFVCRRTGTQRSFYGERA
jgi:hypothetical protein